MKKIILIICLLPIFAFSQVSYKIIADSTILKSISTNSNELVIRNSTKDTTTSVLYNNGNGVTQFKKVRVIGLNDSTYVVKIGTLVVGDTIKIHGQQSLGGTVTSVATDVTLTGGPIISSGTLKVDTTIISTKNYALNIGNNKATFSALNDSITAVRSIRKVDTIYKNTGGDSIVYTINGLRRAIIDRQNTGTVTSIATGVGLSGGTITGSGTIVADTASTLVTKTFLTSSLSGVGGGASLSGITAATAANNISNTNYKQRWNWNTIAGDTAFAILSNSTGAASNLQNLFTVGLSGANASSSQSTYAAQFSNTHTGTSSTNIGARFMASGATNNYAIEAESQVRIISASTGTRYLSLWSSSNECARIGNLNAFGAGANDNLDITNNCNMSIVFRTGSSGNGTERLRIRPSGSMAIGTTGGDLAPIEINKGSFSYSIWAGSGKIISVDGFSATSGNSYWSGDGSLNDILTAYGGTFKYYFTNAGMSVGKGSAPAASAVLDLTSTTQGFLPPRMTATQASAISSPAKALMIYVTNTNGTFTSAGWWGYNGTIWKLILAE